MKRLFDIIASACGLLVLSPVFLIMAIWIKQDSNGPVFYRQVWDGTTRIFVSSSSARCELVLIRVAL